MMLVYDNFSSFYGLFFLYRFTTNLLSSWLSEITFILFYIFLCKNASIVPRTFLDVRRPD